ncbi:MAG: hypothetical protein ACTSX9_01095 [Candidatus Njordarchaeales archaeon]
MIVTCSRCNLSFEVRTIKDLQNGCPRCGAKIYGFKDEELKPLVSVKMIKRGVFSIDFGEPSNRIAVIQAKNSYAIIYLESINKMKMKKKRE